MIARIVNKSVYNCSIVLCSIPHTVTIGVRDQSYESGGTGGELDRSEEN